MKIQQDDHFLSFTNDAIYTGSPPRAGPNTFSAAFFSTIPQIPWHFKSSKHCERRSTVLTSAARIQARGYIRTERERDRDR